jgi:hypothetical protein
MEVKGEYLIASKREAVWAALIDPDILKDCIPGCESLEQISDTEFEAKVTASIGPVKAKFNTSLKLENMQPPESYTLVGNSKGGAAGFGKGSANITLTETDGGTLLGYVAEFNVGGKLAQVGSRLVLGVTKKTADDFFGSFSKILDPDAQRMDADEELDETVMSKTWMAIGVAVFALLIWWFLLR